jgi:aldose 1-epimerase
MINLRSFPRINWATRVSAAAILTVGLAASVGLGTASAAPRAAAAKGHNCNGGPTVSRQSFGQAFDLYAGKDLPVFRYTLANCRGMQVKIITYGGIIQTIDVPGRHGAEPDVVLGFKTLQDYVQKDSPAVTANGGPYFGETIGRFGNRIAKGTFQLDGHTYTLPINNGVNSLHGGLVGFGNHVYASHPVHGAGVAGVVMSLVSPNGDDGANVGCSCTGYPGTMKLAVTFTLDNQNDLGIHYRATTDMDTVLNLTNHSYFNLAGEASGPAYSQLVQINADSFTPTDTTQIPTGVIAPVAGTPFDFRSPHTIGSRISEPDPQLLIGQGYDHNWVLNSTGPTRDGLRLAARAWDAGSRRELQVWTDEPGVQFYSGNFLNGSLVGIGGRTYRQSAGYTFETQHFPNSPNQPSFPSTELKPGQVFNSSTIFQFSSF